MRFSTRFKLLARLSRQHSTLLQGLNDVLHKMAGVIQGKGLLANQGSCYSRVAHFLKNHPDTREACEILIFSAGDSPYVSHAVLVNEHQVTMIDSLCHRGRVVWHNGLPRYERNDLEETDMPLMFRTTVKEFYRDFVKTGAV